MIIIWFIRRQINVSFFKFKIQTF